MKRKFLILNFLIGVSNMFIFVSAQTSYYIEPKVLSGNGFQYQCDVDNSLGKVTLYNVNNKFTYTDWLMKDGSKIREDIYFGRIPTIEPDILNWEKSLSIVNNAFSSQQKTLMGEYAFKVKIIIDSTTGKVAEVNFSFSKNSPYQQVPLSVFRQIEEELKKNIWFTLTEKGKKLNYCITAWMHDFE